MRNNYRYIRQNTMATVQYMGIIISYTVSFSYKFLTC